MKKTKYNFVNSLSEYNDMFAADAMQEDSLTAGQCDNSCSEQLHNIEFRDTCNKSVHYLTKLKEKPYLDRGTSCIYLYYLLYKEKIRKNVFIHDTLKLYETFAQVYEHYQEGSEACENYTQYIDTDIFEKIEKLIELNDNFNKFKSSPDKTKGDGCNHAKTCYDSYSSHANQFCKTDWEDFCIELENFKERYDTLMQSVTTCGEDIPRTLPSIKENNTAAILAPFFVVLLIPLISFTLYKFDLLPSWLQNRIRNKKIIDDYINQGEQSFVEAYEKPEANSNGRPYNLAYQSVEY
ncbi:hypothetical protein POWCR01_000200200 [Plasmodium ovale]|uniref:PIR protein n=1 Tax=Plasmodium ovale TaxID=36330 RepID=A0A1C3KK14_PLAOA|nr:hypothetical protein POWCR01_000200200 [Plasmodium ovale]